MEDMPRFMQDGGERLTQMAARRLLFLGGILAVVLGPTFFLLRTPIPEIRLWGLPVVIVDVVLGAIVLVASGEIRKNPTTALLLALVSSIILLVLGGDAGFIGGLFGLVGALVGSMAFIEDVVKFLDGIVTEASSLFTGQRPQSPRAASPKKGKSKSGSKGSGKSAMKSDGKSVAEGDEESP